MMIRVFTEDGYLKMDKGGVVQLLARVKPDGSQEVVAFAYGPSPLDEYNDVVRQGDALYATGNYSDAVRMYERARRIAYNNKLKTDSAALEDRLAKAKKARK